MSVEGHIGTILNDAWNDAADSIDVSIQDQATPTIIIKFNSVEASTTLASAVSLGDTSISVTSATGFSVGKYAIIYSVADSAYFWGYITAVSGTDITLDTPIDFAFPSGSAIDVAETNLNAIGSLASPVIYGIRGAEGETPVQVSIHITRVIFTCIASSAVDLSKFANLTELANGVVCRRIGADGTIQNIFNVKNNLEIAGILYDFTPYASTNPVQGVDGFVARVTFAGQNKMGVVKELGPGDDLQLLIQDNLSGITVLEAMAQGHVVDPN